MLTEPQQYSPYYIGELRSSKSSLHLELFMRSEVRLTDYQHKLVARFGKHLIRKANLNVPLCSILFCYLFLPSLFLALVVYFTFFL